MAENTFEQRKKVGSGEKNVCRAERQININSLHDLRSKVEKNSGQK